MYLQPRSSATRAHRFLTRSKLLTALVTVLLIMSVVPELANHSAAQTETPPIDPPVEEPTEQATEPPTEVATEPATETPVEQQAQPPMGAQTPPPTEEIALTPTAEPDQQALEVDTSATLAVDYLVCPPGTDVLALNSGTLFATCTDGQDGVTFDLRNPDVLLGVQATGEGGPSSVEFSNVPAGPVTLTRVAPTTHSMAVYCQGATPQEVTKPRAMMPIGGDNQAQSISFDLVSREQVFCWWFVADAIPTASTLIIRVATCPLGYDPAAVDVEEARTTCVNPPGRVTFHASELGGGWDGGDKTTRDQLPWSTQYNNVPNVPLLLAGEIPRGYDQPVAFCGVEDRNGNVLVPVGAYQTSGGAFELAAPGDNVVIECDVFFVPLTTGSVTLLVANCPPGFDVSHDMNLLSTSCQNNPGVTDFTVVAGTHTETRSTENTYPGIVEFTGVPVATMTITGALPAGSGPPVVFCMQEWESDGQDISGYGETSVLNGNQIERGLAGGQLTYCAWFNFPPENSSVTVYKWACPAGTAYGEEQGYYQAECATEHLNIPITLSDANGEHPTTTQANGTEWDGVVLENGSFQVTVDEPDGYGDPVVFCGALDQTVKTKVMATGGSITITPPAEVFSYSCNWFDIPYRDGAVTIRKWTCPAGYDPAVWNANPADDCAVATDGVDFSLDGPGSADQRETTGNGGAVTFDGLEPGSYTATESVSSGVELVFVLDCVGLNTGAVHPAPLSIGPSLEVDVASGDEIVCDWFNVPGHDPATGWLTVSKQICWTPEYVSDVDCEVFEEGQAFDLEKRNDGAWTNAGSGTTDGAGHLALVGLEPGDYRLIERGDTPCRFEASSGDTDGHLSVTAGSETVVNVYNCSPTPPPVGGTMPTKFPNTGATPVTETEHREIPASLPGLAGIVVASTISRRQLLRRSIETVLAGTAGSFGAGSGLARQAVQPIGTPVPDCLYPETPTASVPEAPFACPRGEVPMRITIGTIDLDADIEILETVGGEMQAPSGPEDVAWYKDSARLGETGNILMAGHLNSWGVPEGVFFRLETLREGDEIEIEGELGAIFRYLVQWHEDFLADEEPSEEALGHTDNQSLTLITCGGEWDIDAAEYDHRTVVRAERTDTTPSG